MEKYLAFIIQAFDGLDDQNRLIDAVTITLVDESVDSAMARAKALTGKANYKLLEIIENFVKK